MATPTTSTDQRRFTSLIMSHARLNSLQSVAELVIGSPSHPIAEVDADGWSVWRWEYIADRNHYPEHLVDVEQQRRDGGFAHDVYLAHRSFKGDNYVLLGSPYVRLLHQVLDRIRTAIRAEAAPRYAVVDMRRVYEAFQSGLPNMIATKVTLEMLAEPTLELVSLTGRNPLNSRLHAQIKDVAAPYAIRTEVNVNDQRARVNVDRHGNLWWYQTDESKTKNAIGFLDALLEIGAVRLSRLVPLDRVSDDAD